MNVGNVCVDGGCTTTADIDTGNALGNTNVIRFFMHTKNPDLLHYWVFTTDSQKKIHKGDFINYNDHISIVYSEKWGESRYSATLGTMYDIIHAYGGGSTGYYNENIPGKAPIFARKVIITGSLPTNPTGFGRIKLWE